MIALSQRQDLIADIEWAHAAGAKLAAACTELGLSVRTIELWKQSDEVRADGQPAVVWAAPAHKLSEEERLRVLAICHVARFADMLPAHIVLVLADEGTYLASESAFAWVLRERRQNTHRGRASPLNLRERRPPMWRLPGDSSILGRNMKQVSLMISAKSKGYYGRPR